MELARDISEEATIINKQAIRYVRDELSVWLGELDDIFRINLRFPISSDK